jgi:CheY-like chemotaxis protein
MDVQMPVMDGLEATRQIRVLDGCGEERLPIVAMTAHAMQDDYAKSIDAGMNDHITKPINPRLLHTTLEKWLKVDLHSHSAASLPEELQSVLPRPVQDIDTQEGLIHTNGNVALYKTLLRDFPFRYGSCAKDIREFLRVNKIHEAERIAHSIKSVSAALGMKVFSENAYRVEKVLKEQLKGQLEKEPHLKEPHLKEPQLKEERRAIREMDFESILNAFEIRLDKMSAALRDAFRESSREKSDATKKATLPGFFDREKAQYVIESLPIWVQEDLMRAQNELENLELLFSGTICEGAFSALVQAVRDCDGQAVSERGKKLLDQLYTDWRCAI